MPLILLIFLFIFTGCHSSTDSENFKMDSSSQGQNDDDIDVVEPTPEPTPIPTPTPVPTPGPISTPVPTPTPAPTLQARYYVAKFGTDVIDYNKPTHFFIANDGHGLGELFQEAATGRLRRLKEVFPAHQFVLIAYNETQDHPTMDNAKYLKKWGYEILKTETYRRLSDYSMMDEMKNYTKVHSLDIFSHANTSYAMFSNYSYYSKHDINFVPTATISFFGCNAGYAVAQYIARVFEIPVAGALTSSDFQRLHSLNDFFRNDEHLKPTTGKWSTSNTFSFSQPVSCSKGVCIRMKPDERTYSGMHGSYATGLPYYKFFCPRVNEETCLHAKAQWILGFLSLKPLDTLSTFETYKDVVRDVLCPNQAGTTLKARCTQKLIESESDPLLVYSPFKGDMPSCDWQGCNFSVTDKLTFIDEYHSFLKAYPYLKTAQ